MKARLLFSLSFSLFTMMAQAQTQVTFYTTMGNFVASMEEAKRPITTTNFLGLVKAKFYDGIIFHRVVKGFVIQGGDPTGTGSGGSGVTIPDELIPPFSNVQKTLGMATSGPNTATSQFYINLVDNTRLDANYTAFGTVITNFSVVQAIGNVPVVASRPVTPVVMDSVRITFAPTGVEHHVASSPDLDIFPNPVRSGSLVSVSSDTHYQATVLLVDQLGRVVYQTVKDISAGITTFTLDEARLDTFPAGIYHLSIAGNHVLLNRTFILLR